ncbi:MAG: cell division protein ZapA [Gammaproteobacteria bacterium]|nr:cell division protein ZapA [Gammaproteobacteria bacterium]
MSQPNTVTVKILDKEYQVACPEDQEDNLATSAKYLDKQMRKIRETGKVIGVERIAVMAALNISYELVEASQGGGADKTSLDALNRLNRKLDEALYDLRQMEIS